ncbi:peroxiredoxin family protein [Shewanella surugensis]|uniref:Redoxin domain-containing protein n=1 Tax=Shewanella surugensis TaxID=212020 RepID=A0ABT0LAJ0_9GAMM|nr:redoxin domain-containing protein [Shewanella surugensis]MCL1124726.1 redoxin domain-containing protein [Shewanella surugensis]
MKKNIPINIALLFALLMQIPLVSAETADSSTLSIKSTQPAPSTSLTQSTSSHASPSFDSLPWLAYGHENLVTHKIEYLQTLKGKPTLLMFFKPQCPWCLKQGKAFNRLLSHCPNAINIVALASHGDKAALRKALWKMKLDFPGYLADKAMMNSLGPLPATPITLIIDESGHLHSYLRGYVKLAQLLPQLRQEFGLNCS